MSAAMSELVKNLQEQQKQPGEMKERVRVTVDTWKQNVVSFYMDIKKWLQPLTEKGLVDISERAIPVVEELAAYDTTQLVIKFPTSNRVIELVPKGTYIIGANGRIDLEAGIGKPIKFLLMDEKAESANDLIQINISSGNENAPAKNSARKIKFKWKIVPDDISRGKFEPLTEDVFANIIKQLVL